MAVPTGLSYCNHCGAKLSGAKADGITKSSEVKQGTLVATIAAVFIFGLVAIIFLMMAMKLVFGPENLHLIISFTLLSFLIMLAVETVFIWMLLGRKKGFKETGDTERLKKQSAKELREAKAHMLPDAALSVTEHTTRTLEPLDMKHNTG
jgi:Co/Zn/Cd efflux system component